MSTSETNRNAGTSPRTGKPGGAAKEVKPRGKAPKAAQPAAAETDDSKSRKRAATSAAASSEPAAPTQPNATTPRGARGASKRESASDDNIQAAARGEAGATAPDGMDAHEWHRLVSHAAYLRAERRGFVNGSPEQDWLEAEEEVRRTWRRADG